ncbi:enoyl-CoA hydratase [compost metagenome]
MEQVLLTERHGPVTVLKLNRPDKMNALSFPTLLMLRDAIEALRFDPEVRVVLVTGAGDKAF